MFSTFQILQVKGNNIAKSVSPYINSKGKHTEVMGYYKLKPIFRENSGIKTLLQDAEFTVTYAYILLQKNNSTF